jgi:hypothetical protein
MKALRAVIFGSLLLGFAACLAHGLSAGDFWETVSNGVMICLTCIGVA